MTGGPSHIDTWDLKPDTPLEIRGPFGRSPPGCPACASASTAEAGRHAGQVHDHPLGGRRHSNHEPNKVFQTGNLDAEPRINAKSQHYPAIAILSWQSSAARTTRHAAVRRANMKSPLPRGLGRVPRQAVRPFLRRQLPASCSNCPPDSTTWIGFSTRRTARGADSTGSAARPRSAGDDGAPGPLRAAGGRSRCGRGAPRRRSTSRRSRSKVRDRYGDTRLVPAGAAGPAAGRGRRELRHARPELPHASGTWDTHGDNIPPYGGISEGPAGRCCRCSTTCSRRWSATCDERGLLDDVLVIAMGEFGRTPQIGTQGSTDGRNHWPFVMSMALAGGGLRHGQVIGATERDGGSIGTPRDARRPGGDDLPSLRRAADGDLSRSPGPASCSSSMAARQSANCSDSCAPEFHEHIAASTKPGVMLRRAGGGAGLLALAGLFQDAGFGSCPLAQAAGSNPLASGVHPTSRPAPSPSSGCS